MKLYRSVAAAISMAIFAMLMASGQTANAQDSSAERLEALLQEVQKELAEVEAAEEQSAVVAANFEDPVQVAASIASLQARLDALESPSADAAITPMLQQNLNTVWLVVCAMLVFFMQAGFALLEMGFVRAKNCINVVMKNLLDFGASTISYLLFGFTIMFGVSSRGWVGGHDFWLSAFSGDSPLWAFWFFQAVFVATACTIASGAMAERTKFMGYLVYTIILSGLIYPIFGHWAWVSLAGGREVGFGGSEGWLEALGFHDMAGGSVVHGIGGACALAGIFVLGPRAGKFDKDGEPRMMVGHSTPFVALGALILWMGWFGFNAGSASMAGGEIGRICVNTCISASAGGLMAMSFYWWRRGTPDVGVIVNGILGGLVAVTACADVVTPGSAILIGLIAGVISTEGASFVERSLKLDDVVGAVPVHLFNGIWGTLCVGIFNENGFSMAVLGVQAFGAIAISGGAFLVGLVLFKTIDVTIGLRATEDEQDMGLDFTEHSANAYPDFQTTDH